MRWIVTPAAVIGLGVSLLSLAVAGTLAQTPPVRVFGTVTVDGATPPQGTTVEAFVDGVLCGEGTVRQLGAEIGVGYVVDVLPSSERRACGEDGKQIRLKVGGRDVDQTATYVPGSFIRLDLTVSGAVQTPPPGPTPSPFPAATPAAPAVSPTPAATPAPAASPSPAPGASPAPSPSPGAEAGPTPTPAATPGASPAASPAPGASATPAVTGTPQPAAEDDDGGVPGFVWALIVLGVVAAVGAGVFVYQRGRG